VGGGSSVNVSILAGSSSSLGATRADACVSSAA